MSSHFDTRETQPDSTREQELFARLPVFLQQALVTSSGLAKHLKDVAPDEIISRQALATLPVLRKPVLMQAQTEDPPFGGFVNQELLSGTRLFMSPGPVWEPQAPGPDPWQTARALFAAGLRDGMKVHNAFSYHMTPGGFMIDEGLRALGCQVFPAGVGNTDQQIQAAAVYCPDAYVGTPDFLKVMLDRADEQGSDLSSITRALVSGGALFPALREEYSQRGVQVLQCYATADLGVIAYESEQDGRALPGMLVNEDLIVEIVRPGTDDPVVDGEVGELVVTTFNAAYPLIRFGTGDLSALMSEKSQCGRTAPLLRGWMGRADQRTKVRGMFVDPAQVVQIEKEHPAIARARLVVSRDNASDVLTLLVEGDKLDLEQIQATLQKHLHLKGQVIQSTEPLPNDGIVVADERDYGGQES